MLEINFTPFPGLITERLHLKQLTFEHERDLFELRSNESVSKYIGRQLATSMDEARAFIQKIDKGIAENESGYWAITHRNHDKLIGTICLFDFSKENRSAEIGYELHPDFQGQGIMQEALTCVLDYGFETMKLQSITAFTHSQNLKSRRLLERNHFVFKEKSGDSVIYLLRKNE